MVTHDGEEGEPCRIGGAEGAKGVLQHLHVRRRVVAIALHHVAQLQGEARGLLAGESSAGGDERRHSLAPHLAVALELREVLVFRGLVAPSVVDVRRLGVEMRVAENRHRVHRHHGCVGLRGDRGAGRKKNRKDKKEGFHGGGLFSEITPGCGGASRAWTHRSGSGRACAGRCRCGSRRGQRRRRSACRCARGA